MEINERVNEDGVDKGKKRIKQKWKNTNKYVSESGKMK